MSKTLLLADDSVTIQKVVGISFASEDVKLVTVDNGDDALARARELHPDVVLADVVMPGKTGYELCEAIKADPSLAHIPVLLLTGTFEAFDEERAQRAGAAGHVAKPFEAQALVEQVNRLLASAPPPAAAPAHPAPGDSATVIDAPTNPVVAAPPAADEGDAFDFFDDEFGDASGGDELSPASADDEPLELEEPDSAFAFGDPNAGELLRGTPTPQPDFRDDTAGAPVALADEDDGEELALEPLAVEPHQPPSQDSTVAILPESPGDPVPGLVPERSSRGAAPDLAAELEPAGGDFEDTPEPFEDDAAVPLGASASDDDLAFAFESPAAAPGDEPVPQIGGDDLAEAAVLDPNGASGFDVSSSDLGEPAELLRPPEPESAPPAAPPPAPRVERPLGVEPPPVPPARPAAAQPPPVPQPARGRDAVSRHATEAVEAIAPQLRRELHETLEKIAWESFDGLAEKLVADAVERIEKVAWEVVPQLAEALIREELRRLKGED